jgi:hypothetical protein
MYLRIKLLTVGVISGKTDEELDSAIENEVEFFLNPGEDTEIDYDLDWEFESQYTNEYWNVVPHLEKECDLDEDRIWQQLLWTFEGDFEIPTGMSPVQVVSKVGWELSIENQPDGIELDEFYWEVIDVVEVTK